MCCTGTPATPPTAARASSDETLLGPALAPSPFLASAELAGRPGPAGTRDPRDDPRGAEEVVPRPLPMSLALPGTRRDARARVGLRRTTVVYRVKTKHILTSTRVLHAFSRAARSEVFECFDAPIGP